MVELKWGASTIFRNYTQKGYRTVTIGEVIEQYGAVDLKFSEYYNNGSHVRTLTYIPLRTTEQQRLHSSIA